MTGTIIAHVVDVDVGVAAKQLLPSILKNVVVKHLKSSIGRGVYRIRYIGALTIYNPKKLPKPILCTDIYVEPMQSLYCSSRRSLRRERASETSFSFQSSSTIVVRNTMSWLNIRYTIDAPTLQAAELRLHSYCMRWLWVTTCRCHSSLSLPLSFCLSLVLDQAVIDAKRAG